MISVLISVLISVFKLSFSAVRNREPEITSFKDLATKPINGWSEMTVRLDSALGGYKDLSEVLGVPKHVFRNFGSDQRGNPTIGLFYMLKTRKPRTEVRDLKAIFVNMEQREVNDILCNHFRGMCYV